MKLSRGAITLLLAAFRRVYENAYIKGLASAVVLTGGLAAGAAQATNIDKWVSSASAVTADTVVQIDESGAYTTSGSAGNFTGSIDLSGEDVSYVLSGSGNYFVTDGVTVSNGATLQLSSGANIITSTTDNLTSDTAVGDVLVRGGTISIDGSDNDSGITTRNFTLESGALNLSGTSSVRTVGSMDFKGGTVDVKDTATLSSDSFCMSAGTLKINSGASLKISPLTTDDATVNPVFNLIGGTLSNSGTLEVQSTVKIGDALNLVSETAGNIINIDATTGVVEISSAKLNSYLNATDKGTVLLNSGGTLAFTDQNLELSDFTFSGSNSDSGITSGQAGAINIGDRGTLRGNNITITSQVSGGGWPDYFGVETLGTLTLGNGDTGTIDSLNDLISVSGGYFNFLSHGDVYFNGSGDTFHFDNNKTFSIVGEDPSHPTQVTGDTVSLEYEWGTNVFLAGNVQWNPDIVISGNASGGTTVTIGQYVNNVTGNWDKLQSDTYVTIMGDITAGANGSGSSGATFNIGVDNWSAALNRHFTSTLDLTHATLTDAEGSGTVSFQPNAHGILRLGETQLSSILDSSVFGVTLSGGTLEIDGTFEAGSDDFSNSFAAGKIANGSSNDSSVIMADDAVLTQTSGSDTLINLYDADLVASTIKVTNLNKNGTALVNTVEVQNAGLIVGSLLTSDNASITIGKSSNVTLNAVSGSSGLVNRDLIITKADNSAGTINVSGNWTVQDISITSGGGINVNSPANLPTSLTGEELSIDGEGSWFTVTSSATFDTLNAQGGGVWINGTLNINGDADARDTSGQADDLKGVHFADGVLNVNGYGTLRFDTVAAKSMVYRKNTGELQVHEGVGKINMTSANATLRLEFSSDERFSAEDLVALKTGLVSDASADGLINGTLSVGAGTLAIAGLETGSVTWENFKDFADAASDTTSDALQNATITGVDSAFAGQVGAATLASGTESLTLGGNASFSASENNDGNFVSDSAGHAADIDLEGNQLTLNNGGSLGEVTSDSGGAVYVNGHGEDTALAGLNIQGALGAYTGGTLTIAGGDGDTVEAGSITLDASSLVVEAETTEISGTITLDSGSQATFRDLEAGAVSLSNGSQATFEDMDVTSVSVYSDSGLVQAENLEANAVTASWGGTVRVSEVLSLSGAASTIQVGSAEVRNAAGEITAEASTGTFVAHTLDLNGGTLTLDPAFGMDTAIGSVTRFDDEYLIDEEKPQDGGVINGNVEVFRNSVLGLGTADENEVLNLIRPYQVNGSLTAGGVGSVFAATRTFEVDAGKRVILSSEDSAAFKGSATYRKIGYDALYLGSHAALLLTDEALVDGTSTEADAPKASVTFEGNDARVVAGGGEIILAGDVKARTAYKLFTDGNDGVSVEDVDGNDVTGENGIRVSSQNGVLMGWLDSRSSGSVTLAWDAARSASQLSAASDPVISTLAAYANGANDWQNGTPEDLLYNGYTEGSTGAEPQKNPDYHNALLSASLNYGHGEGAESAARMAVYGGALDAALAVGETTSQAIASRVGAGNPTSEMSAANNAEGAGLWLAPLFRNASADGFEAQGVDYGVDLDLRGVALGADYALVPNLKAGLMFSLGTGTGDGNGAASLVSNDFDYWSVAAYAGYTYGAFTLSGEVSYAQVDNDLDASTGYTGVGELSASTDSENLSAGINALYQFSFDDLKVTPHVGARFSRLSLDDYTVSCESGNVADFDGDSMNVISLPVGVTLTTESQTVSGWSFVPALDVTLTAHAGDDEFEGDVKWAGVSNLSTATATEVIDTFTYGLSAGLNARNGDSFVMGLGISYEGSDNRDAYGVQATARYTF